MRDLLVAAGLRPTTSRTAILAALLRARKPLSAQDVHAHLGRPAGKIGIATVYRTLALLHESGLANRMQSVNEFVYGPAGTDPAGHIVCSKCGKIDDVVDPDLERIKRKVFQESGYTAGNHMVTFYADCNRDECDT